MTESTQAAAETTRSVERALRLLIVVAETATGVGLVDAARTVGLAPSTATRILRTLETTGFVERAADGTYVAGPQIVRLGARHAGEAPPSRSSTGSPSAPASRATSPCRSTRRRRPTCA